MGVSVKSRRAGNLLPTRMPKRAGATRPRMVLLPHGNIDSIHASIADAWATSCPPYRAEPLGFFVSHGVVMDGDFTQLLQLSNNGFNVFVGQLFLKERVDRT